MSPYFVTLNLVFSSSREMEKAQGGLRYRSLTLFCRFRVLMRRQLQNDCFLALLKIGVKCKAERKSQRSRFVFL